MNKFIVASLLTIASLLGTINPATEVKADIVRLVAEDIVTQKGHATVRIKSHGGSGVFVHTEKGKSLILSCAHLFMNLQTNQIDPKLLAKPMKIDCPWPEAGKPAALVNPKVVGYSTDMDLSLISIDYGPVPYVANVAPPLSPIEEKLRSFGHDEMRENSVNTHVKVLEVRGDFIYTRERPIPGRSGGPLLNSKGEVVGICHGYEVAFNGRGIYIAHQSIVTFLENLGVWKARRKFYNPEPRGKSKPRPKVMEESLPDQVYHRIYNTPPLCQPGGK
jgi:hypothetical protein